MEEVIWRIIPEFPNYAVNDHGQVIQIHTNRMMQVSYTRQGGAKVSLTGLEGRRTLSVARLVAKAFVEPPNPLSTAVIVLDGNQHDLRATNIAWRPPSFAWKYIRQLREHTPIIYLNLRVRDVTTNREYMNIVDAAQTHGLLYSDIWRSTYTGYTVYPGNSVFEVVR